MQKKRAKPGICAWILIWILIATTSCTGSVKTGNIIMPSATAIPPSLSDAAMPDSIVSGMATTPIIIPSQTAKASPKASKDNTPTPSLNTSAGQPELLSAMLSQSNLTFGKIAGTQLVMVVYEKGNTKLYCYEKGGNGVWKLTFGPVSAFVGYNGVSSNKKEGDGKTPAGLYAIGFAFGNASKPDTSMIYRKVTAESYWVDDPNSRFYNTWVEGTSEKDWTSAEHLSEIQTKYEYAAVIEYNANPITPGKGSAIFLHCGAGPTVGCVATGRSNILTVLKWLNPSSKPQILITAK